MTGGHLAPPLRALHVPRVDEVDDDVVVRGDEVAEFPEQEVHERFGAVVRGRTAEFLARVEGLEERFVVGVFGVHVWGDFADEREAGVDECQSARLGGGGCAFVAEVGQQEQGEEGGGEVVLPLRGWSQRVGLYEPEGVGLT